ncbi:hypothetical protein HYR69_00255 [Candidatus Sumerlaeota bacterium]|nr:hypothetical protein [Candidatus Sumerlaeota bacterium]
MNRHSSRSKTHNSFPPEGPRLLSHLAEKLEIYSALNASDFREMAKFSEVTNILGLPIHAIAEPIGETRIQEFPGAMEELPVSHAGGASGTMIEACARDPLLLIHGNLALHCGSPFRVCAAVPQSAAHLAHGFHEMVWPAGGATSPARFFLVQIPSISDPFIIHFPTEDTALVWGTDDLRAGLMIMIEAAHRAWLQSGTDGAAGGAQTRETIQLLPGGSFLLSDPESPEGGAILVYSGESVPDEWERALVEKIPNLLGIHPDECALAGAEPLVAEGGGWVSPFWRNPPLPAAMVARTRWLQAASHPDALPFGVPVNPAGEPEFAADENAFVIIPRAAIPDPFVRAQARTRISRLLTHKHSKNEAMKLWAHGFPIPELV